jgi:ketosteroid isomerase-like protein
MNIFKLILKTIMNRALLLIVLIALFSCQTQTTEADDKQAILTVMKLQEEAWSNNDLEGFMEGYWRNDSLKFYGSSGLTKGWQQTLDNYKKGYPTKEHSGTLKFKIHDISKIEYGSYWVMGEYFLKRIVGDAQGVFLIVFKKIKGEWKIVADMSC